MYSIRVATTDDREAPPAEDWPGLSWDRLCDVLRIEVSPEAAALLAEPVADPARGLTHWHIVALEDPQALHALSSADREKLLARFQALQGQIRAYAERLTAAGGESNLRLAQGLRAALDLDAGVAQLWSRSGAPLLTGWGRRRARETAAPTGIIDDMRPARRQDAAPRGKGFIPGLTWMRGGAERLGQSGASPQSRLARLRLSWLMWLPFCLLVAAIFYRLLPACAIDLPLARRVNFCSVESNAALDELLSRNVQLRDQLLDAEKRIAELCAGPPTAPAPTTDETRRRAEDARLRQGKFEVTLAWEGRQDLDLYIYCPGGKLYHGATAACGGALDHDANRTPDAAEDHPLEHAIWEQDPPTGVYRIAVNYYDHGQPVRPVAFTVVVKSSAEEKTYNGVARAYGQEVEVVQLTR
ncbi:hypothetical protein [Methylocapsa acidiphila]|uniref:hypothetical protein n=1 Tax=Methylocapsa acidiphila TaxID=133552 RepID=UPI000407C112|nr:hypothetical protein [Methylocapsa acidiphila]